MTTSTTGTPSDRGAPAGLLEAKLDEVLAELRQERQARQRWQELAHELTGVAQGAMAVASRELEDLSADVTADDVARFLRTAIRTLPQLEVMLTWLAGLEELATEVTSLAGAGMGTLSQGLAEAEVKGWFTLARNGSTAADRVVAVLAAPAPAEPASLMSLLRQLRDPRVRRTLARAIAVAQALGDLAPAPGQIPPSATIPTKE